MIFHLHARANTVNLPGSSNLNIGPLAVSCSHVTNSCKFFWLPRAVDDAREQVAALIGCQSGELIFTAGATESNNLAILGLGRAHRNRERMRIVTTAVEHKAVLLPCHQLQKEGYELVVLPVDNQGRVSIVFVKRKVGQMMIEKRASRATGV